MIKPIRSFLLCTLFACSVAFAAPQQPPPPAGQNLSPAPPQTLRQRLALTKDQAIQFRAINRDRKEQVTAAQADQSLSPSARKQKIRSIHAAAETKIRAILNENQLAEYDQIKNERHEKSVRNHETALPPQ